MKRKLIQLSTSTKVISLPSDWLRKNNLKKGAVLDVTEKDNLILVSKEGNSSAKEKEINITGVKPELIWTIMDGLYTAGMEDIIIQTGSHGQRELLTKSAKMFPGIIVYEEKGDFIRLKNISLQEEFDLNQIISRIRNLTLAIIDDSLNAIDEKKWEILVKIKKRDYTLNTYVSLAFRHINKYGYSPISKQGTISQYVKLLEIFSDRLCMVLEEIGKRKEITKQQKELILMIRDLYRQEANIISKFTFEKLTDFDEKRQKLAKKTGFEAKRVNIDLAGLVQIFFEIEEMAVQLNM